MIIFRYLLKEVAKTQLAVFFVLMTIFISQKFVRVLGDASEGSIPGQMVMIFSAALPEMIRFKAWPEMISSRAAKARTSWMAGRALTR